LKFLSDQRALFDELGRLQDLIVQLINFLPVYRCDRHRTYNCKPATLFRQ